MNDPGYVDRRHLSQHALFGGRQPQLGHLDIELTERCNNACIHCNINLPEHHDSAGRRELSTDQWQDLLRQAAELGALSVRFTGGEPLLRPDFTELYISARKLGMKVILFTNGRLITPAIAELLGRIPPLKKVEISVYGLNPDTSLAITCSRQAFDESRRGMKRLADKRVPFVLKSVLLPPNKRETDAFGPWVREITGVPDSSPHTLVLDLRARRDSAEKNRQIEKMRATPAEVTAFNQRGGNQYRQDMIRYCAQFSGPKGDLLFSCSAGRGGCVDAYGVFQMCLPLRHPEVVFPLAGGSLRQGLEEAFPAFLKRRATNPDYLRRCARCFLMGSLCSQCPGKSWMEHGTLDTPVDYLCSLAHASAKSLGILRGDERAWDVNDWSQRIARAASGAGEGA